MGEPRIDQIYTTKDLSDEKTGVETVAATFTDHLSVVMRLSADVSIGRRGKGFWKMNTFILSEETYKRGCARSGRFGGSREGSTPIGPCGREGIQKQIRLSCIQEGSERRRDFVKLENFLYERIYGVLRNIYPHGQKMIMLNRPKAKITSLHGDTLQRVMLDNDDPNRLTGGRPARFHILQMRKQQEARMIRIIQDECGNSQQTAKGFIRAFTSFLRGKYEPIAGDEECVVYMAETGQRALPTAWRDLLEQPISLEEVHIAVSKGGKNKAPMSDGIGLEFYKANRATIPDDIGAMMNQMFMERKVSAQQKHGLIVCLRKSSDPTTPADLRPIAFLNTDYKIMAQIIAYRLRTMMEELLQPS